MQRATINNSQARNPVVDYVLTSVSQIMSRLTSSRWRGWLRSLDAVKSVWIDIRQRVTIDSTSIWFDSAIAIHVTRVVYNKIASSSLDVMFCTISVVVKSVEKSDQNTESQAQRVYCKETMQGLLSGNFNKQPALWVSLNFALCCQFLEPKAPSGLCPNMIGTVKMAPP